VEPSEAFGAAFVVTQSASPGCRLVVVESSLVVLTRRCPTAYPVVVIEAAGGVIWREATGNRIEILIVHRPRYADWSLPKGKLKRGETALQGALREVREETGLLCQPGPELSTAYYVDRRLRDKRVRYWAMQAKSGRFRRNQEVDEVRWLLLHEARDMLSYDHDVDVVVGLPAGIGLGGPVSPAALVDHR
jgi:8-oxo-dGTP diphosphatase